MRNLEKPLGLEQWRQLKRIALERGYRLNFEGGLFALVHGVWPLPPFALFELNTDGVDAAVQWLHRKGVISTLLSPNSTS